MPDTSDDRIQSWKNRWEDHPEWITEIIACLRGDPPDRASRRVIQLPWYISDNGFRPLTFSPDNPNLILDLRGIPLRDLDLAGVQLSFALLEYADFYKSNLEDADLSFIRASNASFNQAQLTGAKLVAAKLEAADLSMTNLSGVDLSRAHLESADLGWSELKGARLKSAILRNANLERVKAEMANFTSADLSETNFSMAHLEQASFEDAKLTDAKFVAAHLEKANFSYADLENADLSLVYAQSSIFTAVNLKRADLTRAQMQAVDLYDASLDGANLFAVNLNGAGLLDASLNGANLRAANFGRAYLKRADLKGTVLTNTYLLEANIEDADLREADLTDCQFRSQRSSATVNADTKFGHKIDDGGIHWPNRFGRWLYAPLSSLTRPERKVIEPSKYRSLSNQVRMLYRDNGYFSTAAQYFEQENYWFTRHLRLGKRWGKYLGRLLFLEFMMGYGERPLRIVISGFSLILLFGLLFMVTGVGIPGHTIDYSFATEIESGKQFAGDLWACILFSIQCFTTINLGIVKPINVISLSLATFEGLIGILMIALWLIVFVRKAIRD